MNCKPGDKAIVIDSEGMVNNGHLFRVIDAAGFEYSTLHSCQLFNWNVESLCASTIFDGGISYIVPAGTIGIFPDKYLRPLPGEETLDAEPESTTTTRELAEQ